MVNQTRTPRFAIGRSYIGGAGWRDALGNPRSAQSFVPASELLLGAREADAAHHRRRSVVYRGAWV